MYTVHGKLDTYYIAGLSDMSQCHLVLWQTRFTTVSGLVATRYAAIFGNLQKEE